MAERIDKIGFGGFELIQDDEMFCYGVDAVLLADAASARHHKRVADLGTNNGIIPLIMFAKDCIKEDATGFEIQHEACTIAGRNAARNGLSDRLKIIETDIAGISFSEDMKKYAGTFDCVTANPPYFEGNTAVISSRDALRTARHETTAPLDSFVQAASWLLCDKGWFYMIHRPARIIDIAESCRHYRLEPKSVRFISPHPGEIPNLMIVICRKNAGRELRFEKPISVYDDEGNYSDEILKIYGRES